jgi:hypothetical protein
MSCERHGKERGIGLRFETLIGEKIGEIDRDKTGEKCSKSLPHRAFLLLPS